MTQPIPEHGPIAHVEVGMSVVDSDGERVGTVGTVKSGDPGAVTAEGQQMPGGWVDQVVEWVAGAEPDVHPQRAAQLLRTGYLRIDATGWFARDLYAGAEQIRSVDESEVRLTVPRAELMPKG